MGGGGGGGCSACDEESVSRSYSWFSFVVFVLFFCVVVSTSVTLQFYVFSSSFRPLGCFSLTCLALACFLVYV